jgi:hypothetical protein
MDACLFCVCVFLYVGLSKIDYEKDYETEEEARAQQMAVQPLMNE